MARESELIEIDQPPVGWRFWLLWMLANTFGWFGWLAPLAISLVVSFPVVPRPWPLQAVGLAMTSAVGGVVLGAMQWPVLRRQLPQSGWWVLATTAGWAVGEAVNSACHIGLPAAWCLVGTVVGIMQWLILRGVVARAGSWVVAGAVGWLMASVVGRPTTVAIVAALGLDSVKDDMLIRLIFLAAGGAVVGATTGIVLVWLLRQRRSKS